MSKMKLWMILGPLVSGMIACNYTVGECWVEGEDGASSTSGAAGGSSGSSSSGDYGAAPPKKPQGDGSTQPPPPDCNSIGSYSSSLFKFKTTVADDGDDVGGGYQEATAPKVQFVDTRQSPPAWWMCRVWVGMPLRTEMRGKISASRAADVTADVLTVASGLTMHSRSSWIQAAFCRALQDEMNGLFKKDPDYKGFGASVTAQ